MERYSLVTDGRVRHKWITTEASARQYFDRFAALHDDLVNGQGIVVARMDEARFQRVLAR